MPLVGQHPRMVRMGGTASPNLHVTVSMSYASVHHVGLAWLSTWLSNRHAVAPDSPGNGDSERGLVVSRLGFEPRTRGLKVCLPAVHRVAWRSLGSTARANAVHGVHGVGPRRIAVAVNVAVSSGTRWPRPHRARRLRRHERPRRRQGPAALLTAPPRAAPIRIRRWITLVETSRREAAFPTAAARLSSAVPAPERPVILRSPGRTRERYVPPPDHPWRRYPATRPRCQSR